MADDIREREKESIARARVRESQPDKDGSFVRKWTKDMEGYDQKTLAKLNKLEAEKEKRHATLKSWGKEPGIVTRIADWQNELEVERTKEAFEMAKANEDYGWFRKMASNIAIIPGAVEGLFEVADYGTGGYGDPISPEARRLSTDKALDSNYARARYLREYADKYGEEKAKALDEEDKEHLRDVVTDRPDILKNQNFPTLRTHNQDAPLHNLLGLTINEGFENTPIYKSNPDFWNNLKASDSQWFKDMDQVYKNSTEWQRKLDFPVYGTFIEAHKIFTDQIRELVKRDASTMQGWEEDFKAMGAGTIEFLSQLAGVDGDQVGKTPWEIRWEAGKMLTGGLIGTGVAALQPDRNNEVLGIAVPQLWRKPAILTAVVGPGIVRALSAPARSARAARVMERRKADPRFNALMARLEKAKGPIDKAVSAVAQSAPGKAVRGAAEAIGGVEIPFLKIRDKGKVLKGADDIARYSENVAGGFRPRTVGDLVSSGARGSLYWAWSGAPQLGLLHPLAGTLNGVLLNMPRYQGIVNWGAKNFTRSGAKAQQDAELAEQVGQAESTYSSLTGEAQSIGAGFALALDEFNQYGNQTPGGVSVLNSPAYLEQVQSGKGIIGSETIAGLPTAEVILPPNANFSSRTTRDASPAVAEAPPPPKGVEAAMPEARPGMEGAIQALESVPGRAWPEWVPGKIRRLTDDARLAMWDSIGKNHHIRNPEGFLAYLKELPEQKAPPAAPVAPPAIQQARATYKNKVKRLTDEAKATLQKAISENLHKTNPEKFLELVESLPVRRFGDQYRRTVKPKREAGPIIVKAEKAVDTAFNAQYRRSVGEQAPGAPRKLEARPPRPAPKPEITPDRYTMELPNGRKVRIVSERAILEDNRAQTKAFVLEEAANIKQEIRNRIDELQREDAYFSERVSEGLEAAAESARPFYDRDTRVGLPEAASQVRGEWSQRARLVEIERLQQNLELIDVAAAEFLSRDPNFRVKPETLSAKVQETYFSGNARASISTAKEAFMFALNKKYMDLVTNQQGSYGSVQVLLEALYNDLGRSTVDNAIRNQHKKAALQRKKGEGVPVDQLMDPTFPITWDGAIIDGTLLAQLVKEGAVPTRTVGARPDAQGNFRALKQAPYATGEYMGRPRKRSDKKLTERKDEMVDYFDVVATKTDDSRDPTGSRSEKPQTKQEWEDYNTKLIEKELKAERDAIYEGLPEATAKKLREQYPTRSAILRDLNEGMIQQTLSDMPRLPQTFGGKNFPERFKALEDRALAQNQNYWRLLIDEMPELAQTIVERSPQSKTALAINLINRGKNPFSDKRLYPAGVQKPITAKQRAELYQAELKKAKEKKSAERRAKEKPPYTEREGKETAPALKADVASPKLGWVAEDAAARRWDRDAPFQKREVGEAINKRAIESAQRNSPDKRSKQIVNVQLGMSGRSKNLEASVLGNFALHKGLTHSKRNPDWTITHLPSGQTFGVTSPKLPTFVKDLLNKKGDLTFKGGVKLLKELHLHGLSALKTPAEFKKAFAKTGFKELGTKPKAKPKAKPVKAEEPKPAEAKPAEAPKPKAKASNWEKWLPGEFKTAVNTPRAQRSGVMTKLARRIFRLEDMPFAEKVKYWKAMIEGPTPHISAKYGAAKKKGGPSLTDDPAKYKNWHDNIRGYIKGEKPIESRASIAPVEFDAKGGKPLAEQLNADIGRINKAFKDEAITANEQLTALNNIRNNILEDIMEGRRVTIPRASGKQKFYGDDLPDYMSAMGLVRQSGTKAVVSRVGTAAIERAKQTGKSVAKELAGFMSKIDNAIKDAEAVALNTPSSRASKAIAQARNVWTGKPASNVTPEFVGIIKELKASMDKRPATKADIWKVEQKAINKNLSSHERLAARTITERLVAGKQAKQVDRGALYVANQVGINRVVERAQIETAVNAIKDGVVWPVKAAPKAQPQQAPRTVRPTREPKAAPPAEKRTTRKFKTVDEATVPTWLANQLNRTVAKFKNEKMTDVQANAFVAGFSDIWTQGLTMLASESAKKLVYDAVVKHVEKSGVTLSREAKQNLTVQLNEFLSNFNSPFSGRERMAQYSLDVPGPETAYGMLEVALRTLPGEFTFLEGGPYAGTVNVPKLFFDSLTNLKNKGKQKEITKIQKEAFTELSNQWAAQVQVLAMNKVINGEMARLGINHNSTVQDVAARIVIDRLLYQKAMPLGLFNRFVKETTKTIDGQETLVRSLEDVSAKDIANVMRSERAFILEKMREEIRQTGGTKLTDAQARRVMLADKGPIQAIANRLEQYSSRKDPVIDKNLDSFFNDVLGIKKSETADKKVSSDLGLMDPDINVATTFIENISDQIFNTNFNPEYLDTMAYSARLIQEQQKMAARIISSMKGNVTYESLMTNLGNTLGHSLVAGLLTGELPHAFYTRVAKETYSFSRFIKNKKAFADKHRRKDPDRVEAYEALADEGSINSMDFASVESAMSGPITEALMKSGKKGVVEVSTAFDNYRKLRRRIYQLEDNGPRIAETVREYIQVTQELRAMEPGTIRVLPTSKKGMTILEKQANGTFRRGSRILDRDALRKVKVSYSIRKVSGRVFNYSEVPRFIKNLRSGKLGALGVFVTPFISFPYLAIDVPGVKKGIFGSILGDNLTGVSGYTNSPKVTAMMSKRQAKQAMRVLRWGLTMNQFAHPLNSDLDETTRFNMEPSGATAAMIRSSKKENTIDVWRWNNANIFETSMLLMRNVMALQAQAASALSSKARSNKNVEYYLRLNAEGKVLTKNDVVRVAAISGGLFIRSIMQALPKQGNQDKGWFDLETALSGLGGSLIGVDDWNAVRTAMPMFLGVSPKDKNFSSFAPMIRDKEQTDQLDFENMTAQEQMNFMTANWFKAFSRLYMRERKISGGISVNNQARVALAAFRKAMIVPLDQAIAVSRAREKQMLQDTRSMAIISLHELTTAYSNFYNAVSKLETLKQGRTKKEQADFKFIQNARNEVNNLRAELEAARSKAVDALRKSRKSAKKAKSLRNKEF